MADYTCISIGINHYQFLQPLNYAEADAEVVRQFLVKEIDIPPQQFLLLSDASAWMGRQPTYPTRENILKWVNGEYKAADEPFIPTSMTWFFFSGYGVSWQGEDYLLPIDGNPADIAGTGIPMRSLFTALKEHGEDNILVLLDINRSPGILAGSPVGAQTAALAKEMGILAILSTQLDQYSYETVSLGHGFFTAALLEALRYYRQDVTLEKLEQYLAERLPELSEHHYRPEQTPLVVTPPSQNRHQSLLPEAKKIELLDWNVSAPVTTPANTVEIPIVPTPPAAIKNGKTVSPPILPPTTTTVQPPSKPSVTPVSPPPVEPPVPNERPKAVSAARKPNKGMSWWQPLLLWGGSLILIVVAILAALYVKNENGLNPAVLDNPSGVIDSADNPQSPDPQSPPTTSPDLQPFITQNPPVPTTEAGNRAILNRARSYLKAAQASGFNRAIQEARKIPPGSPLYEEANTDIRRWSQVILDIAVGRANEGNFQGAIAAARLVPPDVPQVYNAAQYLIEQASVKVTEQQRNQTLIDNAKGLIQPSQASSYVKAIAVVRQIQPDQALYDQAQGLIEQWSRQIYLIANSRAAQGKWEQAIITAKLVPEYTPSYDPAQEAIARWQKGES